MTFPEHLIDEAHRLTERARILLAEVVEVSDTFDRVCWESTDLPDEVDDADHDRFYEALLPALAALAAIGLKASDATDGLPQPDRFEDMFPDVPEYRRLFEEDREHQHRLVDLGRRIGQAEGDA